MRPRPLFVAVVGLHGSASTWLFNAARELLIEAHGADAVQTLSTERTEAALAESRSLGRHLLWKLHAGDAAFDGLLHLARPVVLVSIRDPRDAVLSYMRRFAPAFEPSVEVLQRDCRRALACAAGGAPVFRYEDGFTSDRAALDRIAACLGVSASPAVRDAIIERYGVEAVRAFADRVSALPAERLAGDSAADLYDRVTQIHRHHIGEAASGGWRERLTAAQIRYANAAFANFLERFAYPR